MNKKYILLNIPAGLALALLASLPSCTNNPTTAAPVTLTQPVTFLVTATDTPTGSPVFTFTSTYSPTFTSTATSTWTPVTILSTPTHTPTGSATPTFTPTLSPTITTTPTSTSTPVTILCSGVFGYSGVNSGSNFTSNTVMFLNRFQCSSTTQLVNLSLNLASGGTTFQLGIYSDAAGLPSSLLGDTGPHTVTGTGWNSATLPSPVDLVNGNYYWLAFHTNATFSQPTGAFPDQATWIIGSSYSAFGASFGGAIDGTGPIRYSLYGSTCP